MRTIPPFKLTPTPMQHFSRPVDFGPGAHALNKRHQLGGIPELIEPLDTPKCSFGNPMTFYAQLDSISEECMLADRGMVYVFVCFNCFETASVLQSY